MTHTNTYNNHNHDNHTIIIIISSSSTTTTILLEAGGEDAGLDEQGLLGPPLLLAINSVS